MLEINGEDSEGNDFSARWGTATDEQIDLITNYAESILGKADTVV